MCSPLGPPFSSLFPETPKAPLWERVLNWLPIVVVVLFALSLFWAPAAGGLGDAAIKWISQVLRGVK